MKYLWLLSGYLTIAINIHAQQFSGTIKDKKSGKDMEMVSVSLLSRDSTIISYTFSKNNGYFNLAFSRKEKVAFISFSHLGYERMQINCNEFSEGQEVKMTPTDIRIKEVKVTPKRLLQKGDTLVYSVSGFKMKQDRTIGDVIRKLPGINVSDDGGITYQGNSISNFYIEGMNLMDDKYGLAVNNIQVDMVKEVEVLENHQAIKALKGMRSEDRAALNLKLNDNAKAEISCNADIGFGASPFLWDNRLLGMLFAKKKQNFSLYKNNNTGRDIGAELNALTLEDVTNMMKGLRQEQNLFSAYNTGNPDVYANRYLFNRTHLFSVNQLWKIKEDRDLHLQMNYIDDNRTKEMNSGTQYRLSADSVLQVDEAQQEEYKQRKLETQLSYTINTPHYYLINKFNSIGHFDQSDITTVRNGTSVKQYLSLNKFFLSNNLKLIKQKDKHFFQLTSLNQFSILPQNMVIKPGLYTDLFNDGNSSSQMKQTGSLQSFFSNTFFSFSHSLANLNMEYEAGVILKDQQLNSELQFIKENFDVTVPDSLRNKTILTEVSSYINPKITYEQYKLKVVLTLNSLFTFINHKDKVSNNKAANHFYPLFLPSLFIRYNITPQWKVSGNASLINAFADIRSLYPDYLFTNYRSVNQYSSSVIGQTKRINYNFSFEYKNITSGFFATLGSYFIHTKRNLLQSQEFNGTLQKNKTIPFDHTNNTYRESISIGKSFSWMSSRLFVDGIYSDVDAIRLQQSNEIFYNIRQISLKLRGIIQPSGWINCEYNMALDQSQLRISRPQESSYSPVVNVKHMLFIHLFPAKGWQVGLDYELYRANNKKIPKEHFADANLSYRFGNNEVIFSLENLFNTSSYRYEDIEELSTIFTEYKMRPRQVLIKYSFGF